MENVCKKMDEMLLRMDGWDDKINEIKQLVLGLYPPSRRGEVNTTQEDDTITRERGLFVNQPGESIEFRPSCEPEVNNSIVNPISTVVPLSFMIPITTPHYSTTLQSHAHRNIHMTKPFITTSPKVNSYSSYALACHNTLCTGQLYYTIESTHILNNNQHRLIPFHSSIVSSPAFILPHVTNKDLLMENVKKDAFRTPPTGIGISQDAYRVHANAVRELRSSSNVFDEMSEINVVANDSIVFNSNKHVSVEDISAANSSNKLIVHNVSFIETAGCEDTKIDGGDRRRKEVSESKLCNIEVEENSNMKSSDVERSTKELDDEMANTDDQDIDINVVDVRNIFGLFVEMLEKGKTPVVSALRSSFIRKRKLVKVDGIMFQTWLMGGCKYGGMKDEHINDLNSPCSTPKWLLQYSDEIQNFKCSQLRGLVLDRACQLLDVGFKNVLKLERSDLHQNIQAFIPCATLKSCTQIHRLGDKMFYYLNNQYLLEFCEASMDKWLHEFKESVNPKYPTLEDGITDGVKLVEGLIPGVYDNTSYNMGKELQLKTYWMVLVVKHISKNMVQLNVMQRATKLCVVLDTTDFEPCDVTRSDLLSVSVLGDKFFAYMFVGGCSYVEALLYAEKWSALLQFNQPLSDQFQAFTRCSKKIILGVYSGGQLMDEGGGVAMSRAGCSKSFYCRRYPHDYQMIFMPKFKAPVVNRRATTWYWSLITLVFDPGNSICGATLMKLVAVTLKELNSNPLGGNLKKNWVANTPKA